MRTGSPGPRGGWALPTDSDYFQAMAMQSINPSTGAAIRSYPGASPAEVSATLAAAADASAAWSRRSFQDRAGFLRRVAANLRASSDSWARLIAEEMGKPVAQGKAEVEKSAWACDYFAEHGPGFLAPVDIPTESRRSYAAFQPLGLVLAVMPWNFPVWQVMRAAAPALVAGNVVALKHASNVCGVSGALEDLFDSSGLPRGVFSSLLVESREVAGLIADPRIQAVTLTGSAAAGRAVARAAGAALKKVVLELGGSDAYVVLEDADIELAARACAEGRLINAGQSCIAAKRMIVARSAREEFERALVREMSARKVGDPMDPATQVGPLARADLRETLAGQVSGSLEAGARCLLGGTVPGGPGFYYPPTVLTDVRRGMPAFDEEVFGPVAAVVPVEDEREAIRCANDSPFGLGAAVFTRDVERGERIAREELAAGSCFINAYVRSDPRLPFGGIKESGFGRELSAFGIREFVNIKTVYAA